MANNYDARASENDGSCTYDPVSISPISSYLLDDQVSETSGLIFWDGYLWTHNDNEDINLYRLDTLSADIISTLTVHGVENTDWEDIAQDDCYLYLGDFGNNTHGNRNDLHIHRVEKRSLKEGSPEIDLIRFRYKDQITTIEAFPNQTDYDCEAFVIAQDSIYLFTKEWQSNQTTVYAMPKQPGYYVANRVSSYDVQGLITGATYVESKNLVVLTGYSRFMEPFLYLLYEFQGTDFFSGNKRKINLSLPFHQVEGIASRDGLIYYLSNESFLFTVLIDAPQQLHVINLEELLRPFLNNLTTKPKITIGELGK